MINSTDILVENNEAALFLNDGPEVQTYSEEVLNSLSHGIGLLLCIPAVFFLLSLARMKGSKWHVVSCTIYGITLMTMYFCSTLYHSVDIIHLQKYRNFFKDLDHCAIYMLIAGTYTPLTLINLVYNNLNHNNNNSSSSSNQPMINGGQQQQQQKIKTPIAKAVKIGWAMFVLIWAMCVLGVGSKLVLGANGVPDIISNSFYLLMGWVSVIGLKDLIKNLPQKGLKLLVSGGITYTGGVGFLIWETAPFNHAVWHLFVSAGTLFHYFCILESLLPSNLLKKDNEHNHHHNHHQQPHQIQNQNQNLVNGANVVVVP
ncbi:hypothetical protein DDB_G0274283 [Dictyostelium discoideum AX4]|uniref:Uncharacterized protein n=1 Tax=Dictyostelium discoideum TaxID=44689 RepID=Q86A98_DICDI|nr:hypothetical protein DDB_G0274283 [Dictyostelium discoideum AX4]EAL70034.1 hypothetical protein DDB_G0274283 [Dictyostelium discoideum AX4]|eukprot:XP_643985.1 hypothetical protein DDB_G0274283 [Dictyostelium discoideum AX4]